MEAHARAWPDAAALLLTVRIHFAMVADAEAAWQALHERHPCTSRRTARRDRHARADRRSRRIRIQRDQHGCDRAAGRRAPAPAREDAQMSDDRVAPDRSGG